MNVIRNRLREYGKRTFAFNENKWMRFSVNRMVALSKIGEEAKTATTALNNLRD